MCMTEQLYLQDKYVIIDTDGNHSFRVRTNSAFIAGIFAQLFRQHSSWGGFGLDWVIADTEDEVAIIMEKHTDGGNSLAKEFTRLGWLTNVRIEITPRALVEMNARR